MGMVWEDLLVLCFFYMDKWGHYMGSPLGNVLIPLLLVVRVRILSYYKLIFTIVTVPVSNVALFLFYATFH